VRSGRVRRAKLYYLRKLRGKAARLRTMQTEQDKPAPKAADSAQERGGETSKSSAP